MALLNEPVQHPTALGAQEPAHILDQKPEGLTLNGDGSFTYTPVANYAGKVTFQYVATDGLLDSAPATVTLNISPVNDPHTGQVVIVGTTKEGQTLTADASLIQDVDGLGSFGYVWEALSGNTWVEVGRGETLTQTAGEVGKTIRVTASYMDGQGHVEASTSNVTSVVEALNRAPSGPASFNAGVTEGTGHTRINLLSGVTDPDGDTLRIVNFRATEETNAAGFTLLPDSDLMVNTDDAVFNGLAAGSLKFHHFTYDLEDGKGGVLSRSLVVNMHGTNGAPIFTPGGWSLGVENGFSSTGVFGAVTDPDGDALTYTFALKSSLGGSVQGQGGTSFFYGATSPAIDALAEGQTAVDIVSFVAEDGKGGSVAGTHEMRLTGVNDAPVAVQTADKVMNEDTTYTLRLADFGFSDVDYGSTLATVSISLNSNGVLRFSGFVAGNGTYNASDVAAGKLTWTPTANLNGADVRMFDYKVNDGWESSANTVSMVADITDVPEASPVVGTPLLVTFDDISTSSNYYAQIPAGYKGFSWDGFSGVFDGDRYPSNPSGYQTGVVSEPNDGWGYQQMSVARPTDFDFESGHFTAAWNNGQSLRIEGWDNGVLKGGQNVVIQSTGPTYIELNDAIFDRVDRVVFITSGGDHNPNYPGGGEFLVVDNLLFGV